jgi:arginine decarboxylase
VRKALQRHKDAKAVLIINPTYFGVCANLREIVSVCHDVDVPVLVDEAHGVHLHFHESLPVSAMDAGADMAATSVHKLGGAMTQCSVLNVRYGRVNPGRVQSVLSMLHTTSTSYILLSSLDTARRHLALNGREEIGKAIERSHRLREQINQLEGLYCFGRELLGGEATYDLDPTKLTIHVHELGMSGYEVEKWLRKQYQIEVEMSDLHNILCIITLGDDQKSEEKLLQALRELSEKQRGQSAKREVHLKMPEIPHLAFSPRDAFYADTESIPLADAEDRIIAEFVMVYPPGIPILLPGEVISAENIEYIREHIAVGLPVQGPEDPSIQNVKVIVEEEAIND